MKRVFWALGGLDINVSCCSDGENAIGKVKKFKNLIKDGF